MLSGSVSNLRTAFEVRGHDGSSTLNVRPAYQGADEPDTPGSSTAVNTALADNGYSDAGAWETASSNITGKRLFRLGWEVKVTSGTGHAAAGAWWEILSE